MKFGQVKQKGKRILAWILAAAIMIVSVPDTMMYAAEASEEEVIVVEGDNSGMSAKEEDTDALPGRTSENRAADTAGNSINMDYTGFVFANGIPITIKERDGKTGIYDRDGNLLSGDTDVSGSAVYGGWFGEQHTASTSVILESGSVGVVFGGSCSAALNGSASVTINGGVANAVYGGGNQYSVNGNTRVTANGGLVGWIYGGGQQSDVTGTAYITVNKGAKIWGQKAADSSVDMKGTVFGGGYGGSVNSTEVTFNGGDAGWVYGGGENCAVTNTHVRVLGTPDDLTQIYGGGFGGTVQKAVLEMEKVSASADYQVKMYLFGGGWNDRVEETEIRIDENCDLETTEVFGGIDPASGNTATVGSVDFQVSLTQKSQSVVPRIQGLNGSGVDGRVSVSFKGIGEISQGYSTHLTEVDEVSIENCRIVLDGVRDETAGVSRLNLERLYVGPAGTAEIPVTLGSISIGELAGSGTVCFAAYKSVGSQPAAVEVEKISASAEAPIKISRTGPGMTDELWEKMILFQGDGVANLESASCFVSALDKYVILKTEDNTIKAGKGDGRIQAYLDPPVFDQESYRYGDFMTITLGLHAQDQTPIAGANVEICAGKTAPYKTVVSVVTDEEGRAAVSLPVNDALWDSCQRGLQAIFWGDENYKQNFYGISLDGGGGSMSFGVDGAAIVLDQEITAPALNAVPVRSLGGEESDFYTAQVIWTPSDAVFLPNTVYRAAIRLVPKDGYSLDSEKIDSITYKGRKLPLPEQAEPDGSLLLPDAAVFEAISAYEVVFSASSFAGVTGASGAGVYMPGATVAIDAGSRDGYTFAGWTVSEGVVLADPGLSRTTFVMPEKDVTLAANWKKIEEAPDTPVTYTVFFEPSSLEGVEGASGAGTYAPGVTVTIDAGSRDGYIFAGWSAPEGLVLTDSGLPRTTFVMPDTDVALILNWKKIEYGEVLPGDVPADGKIPEGLWTAGVEESYLYTGAAIKPSVRVYDYDRRLKEKQDYTVSYKNNKKVNDASDPKKAPAVVVKGKRNYKDTDTVVFAIKAVDLSDDSVTAEDMTAVYNGKVQKKVPAVLFKGKKLSLNKDFTVSYPGIEKENAFRSPGEYEILLTGKGNYTGSRTIKFVITDKTLITKASVKRVPDESYDGSEKKPQLTVSVGKKKLAEGIDYRAEYRNNVEVGTAVVILTGIGDYAGTKKVSFKVTGTSIKGVRVDEVKNCVYDGSAQEPDIVVRLGNKVLTRGTEYEVGYSNNINAGVAGLTIKGVHAYTGVVRKTFRIEAYDFTKNMEEQLNQEIAVKYRKGGSRPEPELVFGDRKLTEGKDYTLTCRNNKAVTTDGTRNKPSFTIKCMGNFKGTVTKEFTITKKSLDDASDPVRLTIADKAFTDRSGGYMSRPVLVDADGRKLTAGKDYNKNIVYTRQDGTVLAKQDKVAAGETVKVKVAGAGAYTGELEAEYRITEKDFRKVKITVPAQSYTGKEIRLKEEAITVKAGKETLTPGTDYEIVEGSYVNHVKKGRASVTIKGKGNYGGLKTVKFRIVSRRMEWFRLL